MRNLLKNIFRYSLKNKATIICLILLFLICVISILTLGLLSTNLVNVYKKVLSKTGLHEIVINEKFSTTLEDQNKKQELIDKLTNEMKLQVRPFESINIVDGAANKYKVIKYSPSYTFDTLYMFDYAGLPVGINNMPTIPNSINFEKLIYYAQYDLNPINQGYDPNTQVEVNNKMQNINDVILWSRQVITFLASKADWKTFTSYKNTFSAAINQLSQNTKIDPLGRLPNCEQPTGELKIAGDYLYRMLGFPTHADPNTKFTPIINQGCGLVFNLYDNISGPVAANYDDYNSYTAIVSPTYLKYNNKKIYSYEKFAKDLGINNNNNPTGSLHLTSASTIQFQDYMKSIPDEYKIYLDSIPYLIVGSGITPDFTYPIISYENVVVDFRKENLLYTNPGGYARAINSWATAPQENLILVKLNKNQDPNLLVKEINALAEKYVGFPDGMQVAFLINDESNIYSPTALRVKFLSDLTMAINAIAIILSIFLTLVSIFVLTIILNKFIKQNLKSLFIMIANGLSKIKAVSSILIMVVLPIGISSIIGYIIGYFLQKPSISIFESYWSLPTDISTFNPAWILLIGLVLMAISTIVIYTVSYIALRHSVATGINYMETKIGWFARIAKKPLWWTNVMVKFRTSIAFSSITKIFFLTFISVLLGTSLTFIGSTINDFYNATQISLKSDDSLFQVDLETPTVQGGQYIPYEFNKIGQTFKDESGKEIYPSDLKNGSYKNLYNNNPLFANWSNIHFPSSDDLKGQRSNLNYLYNKVEIQYIMNVVLGIKIDFPISIDMLNNPWKNLVEIMTPPNVSNASTQITTELYENFITDYRIANLTTNGLVTSDKKALMFDENILSKYSINLSTSSIIVTNDVSMLNDGTKEKLILYINGQITPENILTELKTKLDLRNLTYPSNLPSINTNWDITLDDVKNGLSQIPNSNNYSLSLPNTQIKYLTIKDLTKSIFNARVATADDNLSSTNYIAYDTIDNQKIIFDLKSPNIVTMFGTKLTDNFLNFCTLILSDPFYSKSLYKIIYNMVPYNANEDELYCYIDGELLSELNTKYKYSKKIKLVGIQPNSKMIHLYDQHNSNKEINNLLFGNDNPDKSIPMILNAYAAKKYNLNIGDTIKVYSTNNSERYTIKQLSLASNNSKAEDVNTIKNRYTKTYEVVGISNSAKDDQFYISIDNAQKGLGLYDGTNKEEINNFRPLNNKISTGFNGIFINNDVSLLTNSIALYTNSGNYPGVNYFEKNSVLQETIKSTIKEGLNKWSKSKQAFWQLLFSVDTQWCIDNISDPTNISSSPSLQPLKTAWKNNQDSVVLWFIDKLNNIYGRVAFNSIMVAPNSMQTTLTTFNEITGTVVTLEIITVSLLSVLSVVVLLTLSVIIINDLIRLIALLKVLGFSNLQNAINIFSIFIPCWLLSLILSIPLSLGCLYIFKEFVFVKMGLLVASAFNWWAWLGVGIGLAIIFGAIIFGVSKMLSKLDLNEQLKW